MNQMQKIDSNMTISPCVTHKDTRTSMHHRNRWNSIAIWIIIALANMASLAYVLLRYRGSGISGAALALGVFGIGWCTSWLAARLVLQGKSSWASVGLLIGCASVSALFFEAALEKRIWSNLVVLSSIDTDSPEYYAWSADGKRDVKPNSLPLEEFHRKGDEAAHLAAAMAISATWGNPNGIAKFVGQRQGHNRTYWIARALAGHPPGLAGLYAPVCHNPPAARVWAFLFFLASVCLAWWAGNNWSSETKFGLLCASCFAFLPNLNWWHMTSVSSDIPPAIFTFLGSGILGRYLVQKQDAQTQDSAALFSAGILFGLGTFVTYTAGLAAGAAVIAYWLLTPRESRKMSHLVWLLAPAVCAVFLGTLYSKIAIPNSHTVLGARVAAIAGDDTQGNAFMHPLKAAYIFVTRWPMDLGAALTVFFILIPIWLWLCERERFRGKLGKLAMALAVLLPAATFFWPEIRFTFPSLVLLIVGLGFKDFWESASNHQRSAMIAAIASFGFSKYVLHSLLVAGAA